MAKKDFSTVNTEPVYNTIAEATAEPQETQDAPKRRGRPNKDYGEIDAPIGAQTDESGGKLPRINMAFARGNYEYIRTMARVSGMSMTDFVNMIISNHYKEHADVYERAIEFREANES